MLIGVGVLFRISYSVVNYLYVSFSGLISSAQIVSDIISFCSDGFAIPLGAWDRLCYFILAFPGPSI